MDLESLGSADALKGIAIGAFVGIFSGIFGVGGGVLLVPILIFLYKFPAHEANGTSLVACSCRWVYLASWNTTGRESMEANIALAFLIALGLLVGTYFGARIATQIPAGIVTENVFDISFVRGRQTLAYVQNLR